MPHGSGTDPIPRAGAAGNLRERALQQHMFLVVHDVHPRPVDCNDNFVLWQAGPREPVGLVEPREEEGPLELGIHDDLLLHARLVHFVADVGSLVCSVHECMCKVQQSAKSVAVR